MSALHSVSRSYRAEMIKLRRPGTVVAMSVLALLTVLSTVLTIALADEPTTAAAGGGSGDPGAGTPLDVSLARLATSQGLVLGFRGGATFNGLLIFVLFAVSMTAEYGQGTLRTLFLKEPRRLGWLAGRLGALLAAVAVALLAALGLSVAGAAVLAPLRDVDTSAWWTFGALGEAAAAYLNALLAAAFFAVAGTALGVALRSTTAALLVGIAWMFPIEHIIQDSWGTATSVLPGLVFDAVGRGGVPAAAYTPALLTALGYALLAAALTAVSLHRRDVTA
ncbi:ABC-2 family transporter protein [Frankia sp. EI5c]|uniref:ABC transporter n=1 Tax=Frankia sp. EI5c TaxID=683316 RepID=UPI0007C27C0C|nr:ABC transporter [Frankia sp. EI5c]OAA25633.1 ABC-2 family transporter protein [Frankia sp. EI5c]